MGGDSLLGPRPPPAIQRQGDLLAILRLGNALHFALDGAVSGTDLVYRLLAIDWTVAYGIFWPLDCVLRLGGWYRYLVNGGLKLNEETGGREREDVYWIIIIMSPQVDRHFLVEDESSPY